MVSSNHQHMDSIAAQHYGYAEYSGRIATVIRQFHFDRVSRGCARTYEKKDFVDAPGAGQQIHRRVD